MDSIFNAAQTRETWEETLPRVELVEYERSYTIKADIHDAGFEGVAICLDGGALTITSEDRSAVADSGCVLPRLNSFRFTLFLPDDADQNDMSIACEGRILSLNFSRKAA